MTNDGYPLPPGRFQLPPEDESTCDEPNCLSFADTFISYQNRRWKYCRRCWFKYADDYALDHRHGKTAADYLKEHRGATVAPVKGAES